VLRLGFGPARTCTQTAAGSWRASDIVDVDAAAARFEESCSSSIAHIYPMIPVRCRCIDIAIIADND
jgi:hypothetical protein